MTAQFCILLSLMFILYKVALAKFAMTSCCLTWGSFHFPWAAAGIPWCIAHTHSNSTHPILTAFALKGKIYLST